MSQRIEALEAMAEASWNDPPALVRMSDELRHRPTPRARGLRQRIEERLEALGAPRPEAGEDLVALLLAVETLKARLAAARREVEAQQFVLDGLKAALDRAEGGSVPEGPYARIHALETIPDFALRALRHAFLREHHPDRVPEAERAAALRTFVEYDGIFREIERRRRPHAA